MYQSFTGPLYSRLTRLKFPSLLLSLTSCIFHSPIHAHTRLSQDKEEEPARVLLVGTRRDELPDKSSDLKEIDYFIEKSLMAIVKKPFVNYIYSVPNSCGVSYFVPVENSIDFNAKGKSYLE